MRSPHLPKLRFVGYESTEPALRRTAQKDTGVPRRSWCQSSGKSLGRERLICADGMLEKSLLITEPVDRLSGRLA